NFDPVAASERLAAGDHFIERDSEAEYISAVIDALARSLLRRPIPDRPVRHAGFSNRSVEVNACLLIGRQHLGQTEVAHFDLALIVDDDIVRFDVAVDYAARMSRRDRVGDLNGD